MNKYVELWAMNVFYEWRVFRDFDTRKFIVDMSKDKGSIKDLMDMLSSFVLQVAKKDGSLYHLTRYNFLPFLKCLYNWVFIFCRVFFLLLSCLCFYMLYVYFYY